MRLEARFSWQHDRFGHQVVLVHQGSEQVLLCSMEGNDQQEFPPSPVIQDMSVERRPDSQVALGVGMAGSAMWSLSSQASLEGGWIEFDWACQPRGTLLWPRNCYLGPWDLPAANTAVGQVELTRWRTSAGTSRSVFLSLLDNQEVLPGSYEISLQKPSELSKHVGNVNGHEAWSVLTLEHPLSSDTLASVPGNRGLRWRYRLAIYE